MRLMLCAAAVVGLTSLSLSGGMLRADDMGGMQMPATAPATQPMTGVDVHNTVCPVSGDKVGDSPVVTEYDGKIYHFCCADCVKEFKADPDKFVKKMAANPDKYGIKPS
jgi:YHS domain-containing protein